MNEPNEPSAIATSNGEAPAAAPATRTRWSCLKFGICWLAGIPGVAAILLVRIYQLLISPLFGRTCRFHPSCSQYFILAVRKYGLIRGAWKGTARICRCHPWNPGGFDPP